MQQLSHERRASWRAVCGLLAACIVTMLAVPVAAHAATVWKLDSNANSPAAPGSAHQYFVELVNLGDTDSSGVIRLTMRLPRGITPVSAFKSSGVGTWSCPVAGDTVECSTPDVIPRRVNAAPGNYAVITLNTTIDADASGTLTARLELEGGGGATETVGDPTEITSAEPDFGIDQFDGEVTADAAGTAYTQAGGHPYGAGVTFSLDTETNPDPFIGPLWPVEALRSIAVDLPPGLVGDPTAVAQCTPGDLASSGDHNYFALCSPASQVGTVDVRLGRLGSSVVFGPVPVYSIVPPPDVPAQFGFNVVGTVVTLNAELRSEGDYGLTITSDNVSQGLAIFSTTVTLWGEPSDPVHLAERACPGEPIPLYSRGIGSIGDPCPTDATGKAFLRNPTSCTPAGVGLPTTMRASSWQEPDEVKTASFVSHNPPGYPLDPSDPEWGTDQGPTGCRQVPFDPELDGQPVGGSKAGAPAGFTFDLTIPQTDDPDVIGQSDLKKAVVTLPEGVRVSPSSAAGLGACSPSQIGLDSREDPTCPDASKIGSLTIDTPLLDEQLAGAIYLAAPFDNPFDSLLAIYLVAEGPGLIVKLPGKVETNPTTGQLTATFDDNPQLPFSSLHLEFNGGSRAPLTLPKACGTYTTHAELTGWNGRTEVSDSSFTLTENARGEPCPSTFTPGFNAGTENPVAGGSSTFVLRMTRDDEDQELKSVKVDMPPGLLGRIADAVLCADGAAGAGTCGDGSLIGNVTVGAGAGTDPFYITNGRVHVTEGYRGAPFGLSIVVPAIAGPFDLGTVVVRSALYVDRHTAELSVVSDPLPTILEGIPLDVRDVRVTIDRPGFMVNPTSCEEMRFGGKIESTAGSVVDIWNLNNRFQVGDCAALPLRPRMRLVVGGRRRTQRGRSTPLRATLRQSPGQAALSKVRVTLPTALNARLTVINDACTREEYDSGSDACEFARTGSAVAITPLLRDPLRGGVYFVRNGNPLPDLFVRLRGQVDFDLVGKITIPGSKRLRTTFDLVPDVPISMFSLRLESGRDGSIGNAANLCSRRGKRARAALAFVGQNGKRMFERKRLKVRGCSSRAAGKRARRRGRR